MQGGPLGAVGQPAEFAGAESAAGFDPAVIFFHRLMPAGLRQIFGMIQGVIEEGFDLPVEHLVVGFECEHVVGVGFVDFPRDGFLAAHGVEGDDAAGQLQAAQEFGHGGDFVALLGGATTRERRYYLSSLPPHAPELARAIRGHWSIENSLHWVLDVALREDDCRVRTGHAATHLATLRHRALNLLRQDTSKKRGIRTKPKIAGWDHRYLIKLLSI